MKPRFVFFRLPAALLCLILAAGLFTAAPAAAAPLTGDINADGGVNAADALLALQHSVRLITLAADAAETADVNRDGAINAADALLILQYSVKLIDGFPADENTPPYRHVIVIGIDGAGNFHTRCDTPNTDALFLQNGAWTDTCRAAFPSISAQCWGAMLTGVKPRLHGVTNESAAVAAYDNPDYPSFFRLVRTVHPDAALGCFCNWWPISAGMVENGLGVTKETADDALLTDKICAYIQNERPELLFIQFDSVDHAGHSSGYGSPDYLRALETVDGYVGRIYQAVRDAGIADDTLFLITADHGGIGISHGGNSEQEMNVFFGACGKGINPTGELKLQGRDLAAIVCYALGVPGNANWDSYVPQNLFTAYMTPPARPPEEEHLHTGPTPAADSELALANFVDAERLRAALFLDGDLTDQTGRVTAQSAGDAAYTDGYYGRALQVNGQHYLSLPGVELGTTDFTLAFWLKVDAGVEGDPAVFSNKNWNNGSNPGIVYCYRGGSKINVGNGSARDDFDCMEPEDFTRWHHIALAADRQAGTLTLYVDFEKIQTDVLREELKDASFDSGLPLNFGNDGTGRYAYALAGAFDDVLLFDKALSAEEIGRMSAYYGY